MKKLNLNTLKQPFVIIMVGPPLVGKSTTIKEWKDSFKGNFTVISRDALLLEEHGSDNYNEAYNSVDQKAVDKKLINIIEDANENKDNTIIDMTHMSSKRRTYNLRFFDDDYYKLAVVFPIPPKEELMKRNIKRNNEEKKFIPIHVIDSMCKSFMPIKDSEGFNKVISL